MSDVGKIVEIMGVEGVDKEIQLIQTAHRLKIINFWQIPQNARVLEIGCGQGDTTAALAYVIGEGGFVHALDTAPPTYGSPFTLGQARERLQRSEIGSRIKMDFETDFLTQDFPANSFDAVVLLHCSWYFKNPEVLLAILRKARQVTDRLCFAEWNITPRLPGQLLHHTAVMIQAECECFRESSESNVRTLFTPPDLLRAARETGWEISETANIFTPELHDGRWETTMTLTEYPAIINSMENMPGKMKKLLLSKIEVLKNADRSNLLPLDTFAFLTR